MKATVSGVDAPFAFVNPSRLEFDTAPVSGAEIRIFRQTDVSSPSVDFTDGAIVRGDDLDAAVEQPRARAEELGDQFTDLSGRAVKVQPGEEPVVFPTAAERLGKFLAFGLDGTPIPSSGTGADAGLRADLLDEEGAQWVGFTQADITSVARTALSKARESLSILDYINPALHAAILDGTSTADVTAAFELAKAIATLVPYAQRTLNFPAGKYNASQFSLRGLSFLTLHALGTVQLVGNDGSKGFIVGDNYFDQFGHVETYTQNLRMTGGPWLISPSPGQVYTRGLKLQNVKDSVFENLSVSGDFTPSGGVGERVAVELELSFNNAFYNCTFSLPDSPPIGTDKAYAMRFGDDNVNNNRFFNFRVAGHGSSIDKAIAVRVTSTGANFFGGDISSVHTAFELNAAQGFQAHGVYHEGIGRIVNVTASSTGAVIMPAFAEVISGTGGAGIGYNLGGDSGTVQTIGFTILGGLHRFTGADTVGIAKGSNCYGLTYQAGVDSAHLPTTPFTGTDRGSGGTSFFNAFELTAAKINFPDNAVPSANPTTLDDYREIAYVPAGVGVTFTTATGFYIKVGGRVKFWGHVEWPTNTNTQAARITIPFTHSDTQHHPKVHLGWGSTLPAGAELRLVSGAIYVYDSSGNQILNDTLDGVIAYFEVEYPTGQ